MTPAGGCERLECGRVAQKRKKLQLIGTHFKLTAWRWNSLSLERDLERSLPVRAFKD